MTAPAENCTECRRPLSLTGDGLHVRTYRICAAAAQHASDRVATLASARPLHAQEGVLRYVAELRAAILDGAENAPDVNAARRVLHRLAEKVLLLSPEQVGDVKAPRAGDAFLVLCLREEAIEDWVHTNNFTGEVSRESEDTREPACGQTLHDAECPDCWAFDRELTAEPYVEGEFAEPTPVIRKATLEIPANTGDRTKLEGLPL
jgi:hypothetical protein